MIKVEIEDLENRKSGKRHERGRFEGGESINGRGERKTRERTIINKIAMEKKGEKMAQSETNKEKGGLDIERRRRKHKESRENKIEAFN